MANISAFLGAAIGERGHYWLWAGFVYYTPAFSKIDAALGQIRSEKNWIHQLKIQCGKLRIASAWWLPRQIGIYRTADRVDARL